MAYKRERNYTLEKERDLSLTIAPEGTPLPDRVCGGCAHYRAGGSCAERRKDVRLPLDRLRIIHRKRQRY